MSETLKKLTLYNSKLPFLTLNCLSIGYPIKTDEASLVNKFKFVYIGLIETLYELESALILF